MYVPRANAVDDAAEVAAFVRSVGAGDLVTVGSGGTPLATLLPVIWDPDNDRLIAHMARANDHWEQIEDGSPGLVIVNGAQAYVSPAWYESKARHGRVVPTWNYSTVHLTGTMRVHDDPAWVRAMVTELTERHEADREAPWAVDDAPPAYVEGQLRAIVGIEMDVASVEAKAKLSQNRSAADRNGVVEGLRDEGGVRESDVAAAMTRTMP